MIYGIFYIGDKMRNINLIILIFPLFFLTCSKKPSDVLNIIKAKQNSDSFYDISEYYTKGTLKVLEELEELSPKDKSIDYSDKKFAKGINWEIIDESIDDDKAEVIIKYIAHPIENMKGLELIFSSIIFLP